MSTQTRALSAPLFAAPKSLVKTAAALTLCLGMVTGCSSSTAQTTDPSPTATVAEVPSKDATAATLEMDEAWAKSASASDDHAMTGIFGLIHNPTSTPISIVGANTDVADMVELHETIIDANGTTVMQAVDEGFSIDPGQTLTLEPGGDHVMLMGLTQDLIAGDQVAFSLTLSTGDTMDITAEIRDYSGAQETYSHEETDEHGDHGESSQHDESHDH